VLVTDDLLEEARRIFERRGTLFLFNVAAAAFPHLATKSAARAAVKRGDILVDGVADTAHDAPAPAAGARLTVRVGKAEKLPQGLEERLERWNASRAARPEAQIRVLFHDPDVGWAVVNKPPEMHSSPCGFNNSHLTFETYLPALLPPPLRGTRRGRPAVAHRLDFRVAGPMVVAIGETGQRHPCVLRIQEH